MIPKASSSPTSQASATTPAPVHQATSVPPLRTLYVSDEIDADIIAAARELLVHQGDKKLTMVAIARKAQISRPTLYARYSNSLEVTREVLNREMARILDVAFPLPRDVTSLIDTIISVADVLADNGLIRSLLQNNPEILVTYQYQRLGKSQIVMIRFLRNVIRRIQQRDAERRAQQDSSVPCIQTGDPQVMATFVLAVVQGVSLQSSTLSMMLGHADTWQAELKKILKGYLIQCPPPLP